MRSAWAIGSGIAVVAVCSFLVGCGGEPDPDVTLGARLEGPPLYRAARENLLHGAGLFNLRSRAPCRLRFRIERTGQPVERGPGRVLGPGEAVRIWWQLRTEERGPEGVSADADPKSAMQLVRIDFGYDDMAVMSGGGDIPTRPGRSRVLRLDHLPASVEQEIAFGSKLELLTVAVVDLDGETPELVPREGRNLLRPAPGEIGDEETLHVTRLYIEVERAGQPDEVPAIPPRRVPGR